MNIIFELSSLLLLYLLCYTIYKIYYNNRDYWGDVILFLGLSFGIIYTYPLIYIIMMTNIFYNKTDQKKSYTELIIFLILSFIISYNYPIIYVMIMTNVRFDL
jgi:hypothetical protein